MQREEIVERLTPFLRQRLGADRLRIDGVRSLTGGAVRETWLLEVTSEAPGGPGEARRLVLLAFRPDPRRAFSPENEFKLLEKVHRAGVPVPRPFLVGDESVLGQAFYLSEFVPGETIGRRLVKESRFESARVRLAAELAGALAAIHRVELDSGDLGFLPGPPPNESPIEHELATLEAVYRQMTLEPHPAFEVALRWLARNTPARGERVLVHGDYRIGNVIVDERGLRAVLDWELAHVGDPLEDVGWMCVRSWRFGMDHRPVGGIGEREEFYRAYEDASGRRIDRGAARFWEVYGNLRWGVFTLVQLRAFTDGLSRSVELASIGRRTAETEWELLNLLEGDAY
jgi:aminoglycoside phosphotransferase (APT) family kinase protein